MVRVDLHGMTQDEALSAVDEFLYETYKAGLSEVSVVHGKGTGVLRGTVRRYLTKHPLVQAIRVADPWDGGNGATVVEFKTK
jgi:DNA mismatch repair protein MutS2